MPEPAIISNASFLHALTRWIMAQPRQCLIDSYDNIFRFVAFAHLVGKMSVLIDPETNQFEAVIFHWRDFQENVEAKEHYEAQQFEFKKQSGGDCLFVGEAIGTRESVSRLYKYFFRKYPQLTVQPIFTFRHKKLVRLNPRFLKRFMYESEGGL